MSTYFTDTSALVKRYLLETGSAWLTSLTTPSAGHVTIVAESTIIEGCATFSRRNREGTLSLVNTEAMRKTFLFQMDNEPGYTGDENDHH